MCEGAGRNSKRESTCTFQPTEVVFQVPLYLNFFSMNQILSFGLAEDCEKSLRPQHKTKGNQKTNGNSAKFFSHTLHFFLGKHFLSGLYLCIFTMAQTVTFSSDSFSTGDSQGPYRNQTARQHKSQLNELQVLLKVRELLLQNHKRQNDCSSFKEDPHSPLLLLYLF